MVIVLNNKSNFNKYDFQNYLEDIRKINTMHKMILCPTYLNIPLFESEYIELGAQNVSCEEDGAYTGEISANQLKSFDVKYCIVGHSERRKNQNETNEEIHKKIIHLLKNQIQPILCIGETKEQRENGLEEKVICEQLETVLSKISEEDIKKIIVAYEPIWSIGTGIVPNNNQIDYITQIIKKKYPKTRVIYGGSVNETNIDELKKCQFIDGYLLGGLSLNIEKLATFVNRM